MLVEIRDLRISGYLLDDVARVVSECLCMFPPMRSLEGSVLRWHASQEWMASVSVKHCLCCIPGCSADAPFCCIPLFRAVW